MSDPLRLGDPHRHYQVAVSVDALALAWARSEEAPEGALVTADEELSARGRRGPVWISRRGGSLAAAVILRPELPPAAEGLLWLLASVAAADGLAGITGLDVKVDWPNEILINDAVVGIVKSTALLGPGRIELAVLSLRLNTKLTTADLPEGLRHPGVTSLSMQDVHVDHAHLTATFLTHLRDHYEQGTESLLRAYSSRCATLGETVRAQLIRRGDIAGRATRIDMFGRLILTTSRGVGSVSVDVLERLQR